MEAKDKFPRGIEVVSSGIIQHDGKILLAKSPKWSDKWTFPGGHLEIGERIIDSCVREIAEETGLSVAPVRIIHTGELIGSKDFHRPAHFVYFDIVLDVIGGKVDLQKEELSEYGWFTPEEALMLDLAESFEVTIQKYLDTL